MEEKKAQSPDERESGKPNSIEAIDPERFKKRSREINDQGFNIIGPDGKTRYYGNGG